MGATASALLLGGVILAQMWTLGLNLIFNAYGK
jgi:hypothetical protein